MRTRRISFTIALIASFILGHAAAAFPEYSDNYLRKNLYGDLITTNSLLGRKTMFSPQLAFLCSANDSTVFFTESYQTGSYLSRSSKRLYQWDGHYIRYLNDMKLPFYNGEKTYSLIKGDYCVQNLTFEGEENGITYYYAEFSNLFGGWRVTVGFDQEKKLVAVEEKSVSDFFSFTPYEYFAVYDDMPDFILLETTSKSIFDRAEVILNEKETEHLNVYDAKTKNTWKTVRFIPTVGAYFEDYKWRDDSNGR